MSENDTVYVRRKIDSKDSIKQRIIERYLELEVKDYRKVNIAIQWNNKSSRKVFNYIIKQCIDGYFYIANEQSHHMFNKEICNLSYPQLFELANIVPFKMRTDFWGGLDLIEFVPWAYPSPPPAPIDVSDILNEVEDEVSIDEELIIKE